MDVPYCQARARTVAVVSDGVNLGLCEVAGPAVELLRKGTCAEFDIIEVTAAHAASPNTESLPVVKDWKRYLGHTVQIGYPRDPDVPALNTPQSALRCSRAKQYKCAETARRQTGLSVGALLNLVRTQRNPAPPFVVQVIEPDRKPAPPVAIQEANLLQTRVSDGYSSMVMCFDRGTDWIRQGKYGLYAVLQIDAFMLVKDEKEGEDEKWMLRVADAWCLANPGVQLGDPTPVNEIRG